MWLKKQYVAILHNISCTETSTPTGIRIYVSTRSSLLFAILRLLTRKLRSAAAKSPKWLAVGLDVVSEFEKGFESI